MNQSEMIVVNSRQNIGNKERDIYQVTESLRKNRLLIPPFQREFCWDTQKIKGWIKTVVNKNAIGVIVTYQLDEENSPIFLADGLQRLTATIRFIDNPQEYGYKFSTNQAIEYCQSFDITVQHRIYKTHDEAFLAFKNINSGTSLTPEEFNRGDLALVENGMLVIEQIKRIFDKYEARLLVSTRNRMTKSKANRDIIALFLQYAKEETRVDFWGIGTSRLNGRNQSVEKILAEYIQDNPPDQLNIKIRSFEKFVASHFAYLESVCNRIAPGKPFGLTTSRYLLHLSIWRKNTNVPVDSYNLFCNKLIEHLKDYSTFTSRFICSDNGNNKTITLHLDNLSYTNYLCDHFGIENFYFQVQNIQKRKQKPVRNGYDNSHILPFSEYGNGNTFPEPQTLNRSRGAKPIEGKE